MDKDIKEPVSRGANKHGRAADELFHAFAEKINTGALSEGQPLPPEREIVETYGVSRTVVREAVLALANKGLVKARPRYRPVVRKPSFDTAFETVESVVARLLSQPHGVKNLYDTRIMIEAALVRQAATESDKEDIATLKKALRENKEAVEDSELFYQTDVGFHAVFYGIPRNPLLPAIHRAYISWLSPQWSQMPLSPSRNRINFEAHEKIYWSILMRDPDRAESTLRRHLADAWDQVRQTFGEI